MTLTTQQKWNDEGTRLSYGSTTTMIDEFNDDMVTEFTNPRNDAGPFTQPTNVDENSRRSTQIGQAPACGTHNAFIDRVKIMAR